MSGITINGALQHASPNMGSSRLARGASNTSPPVSNETGDYSIRGAAAAQGRDLFAKSPRRAVFPGPRTRNPLTRSPDVLEDSDEEYNAPPRRHRSAKGDRSTGSALEVGARDQLRDTGRRSRSPQRLGKIFHRERSPPRAPRSTSSARHHASSDDWISSDRADHRVTHQRSPAERRKSFEDSRRPSWRNANGESWSSSSPGQRQDSLYRAGSDLPSRRAATPTKDDNADLIQPRGHSPSRQSGRQESSPAARLNQDERGASHHVPAGFESAPRGPKSFNSRVPLVQHNSPLPDVSPGVLGPPHAFISSSILPTNQSIRNDLFISMRHYKPMGLHMDRLGYYITFKNDAAGHEALRACIREKQNSMLYGHYSLTLTPFPWGQREFRQRPTNHTKKSQSTESGAREEIQRTLNQSRSTLSVDASTPQRSTVRTGSRDAQDDVSSNGGATTTSSISRCKGTCHVCNELSSSVRPTDISCSTCPRRYHRMCTINPPSSSDQSTWQCIRCVRRKIEAPASSSQNEVDQDNIQPANMPPDATTEVVIEKSGVPVPRSLPPVQSPPTHRTSDRQAPTPEAALSPVHETDGMTDDTARNCSSEKRAPLTSLQDQHYDEADDLVQQSFAGLQTPTFPADDGGQQLQKAIFVRKKVSKPAQECNVMRGNSDPEIAAPAIAHPHPQASIVPNVSLQRDMNGVSPRILRRTATISRDGPGSIELGKDSTKKTSEAGTLAVIPKINQPLPEYLSQQAETARSESRMEGVLPEIPESPSEPHRNDHNARSEPGIASEKGKDVARPKLTSQTARRTKFQHRSCIDCGTIVSTKSSVARFFCLSCQKAAKIALPASGAVDQPGDGPRTEGACRPSQKQVAQHAVREADMVRQPVTEMPEDGGFTQTTTATEPSPAPAAVIVDTVEASSAEFRKVTASSALDKAAGLVPSHQASHSRGKHTYSYHRMIGMALCDRGPLQARGIAAWIIGNIPGMDGIKEKSSMLGNVSGIVSMNADGKGKQLFRYRAWKAGDSTEFGTGTWIELQADKLDKHERWDPVLKEPVSPPRALKVQSVTARHGPEASHGAQKPSSAMLAGSKTCEQSDGKGQKRSIPRPEIEDDASSDEEPLSKIRPAMHRVASAPVARVLAPTDVGQMESGRIPIEAVKAPTPPMPPLNDGGILGPLERPQRVSQSNSRKASPLPDSMDIESNDASTNGASAAQIAPTGQSRDARPKREPLGLQITAEEARSKTAEQIIELDYKLVTHSANSLYLEWPEYAPENHIDKRAIMAEIKKRPTRKQMFGKPACYSRLAGSITQAEIAAPFVEQRTGKQSLREGPPSQIPENGKENIKQSERLEDFFGLPTNPLAILVDGKLAYRDGTRNDDGELVRAKAIYRTGL